MDARILGWSLLICLSFGAPLTASTAEDYTSAGRARLFDGTRSGPSRGCAIIAAGLADAECAESAGHRELLFLHALARTTELLGDPNDNVVPDGLLRWFEPFSTALATGIAVNLPSHLPTSYDARSAAGQMPCGFLGEQIDEIVAELDSIADGPTPFLVTLVPEETGLKGELEIDYGDVLMFKSVLLACRTSLAEGPFFEIDTVGAAWLHDPRMLERLAAWVETAPCPLGFDCLPGQDRGWRAYWADAVECYVDAVAYIVAENDPPGSDPQQDELVYIDPSARAHIDRCMVARDAPRDVLCATVGPTETAANTKVYAIYDANSVTLGKLVLVFDPTDTGGREGRLTLSDGTELEVDWFGILDASEIGISMFAPDRATQGWLQGAIAADRSAITDATVDFWGADPRVMAAVTARLTGEPAQASPDTNPLMGASLPSPSLEMPVMLDELLARVGRETDWDM